MWDRFRLSRRSQDFDHGKLLNAPKNDPNRSKSRLGTVPGDVEADNFEIGTGFRRPVDFHQEVSSRSMRALTCS